MGTGERTQPESSCLARQLARLTPLSGAERAALGRLEHRERAIVRGAVLQREGEPARELYVLASGSVMGSLLLDDGRRQILRFYCPGDLLGLANLTYRNCTETLTSLTSGIVRPIDPAAFAETLAQHPRLGLLLLALAQVDRAELTDRLAGVGRTSARSRVAALLIEIRNQRRRADPALGATFALGLTQEEIGDATGLTAVHVSRMLRQIEDEGLIAREAKRGRITLLDEPRLAREADFVDRYAALNLEWLPTAGE